MIKTFGTSNLINIVGCWKNNLPKLNTVVSTLVDNTNNINIIDIMNSPHISIKDKRWFLFNSCNLSIKEKQILALESAKSVAYIFNSNYPTDNRIKLCINITARYLKGLVSLKVLIKYKKAAYAAAHVATSAANAATSAANAGASAANAGAYAAYAAAHAGAYAANAAAYAATNAADAADYTAAYAAANAATYAADAAYAANAKKLVKIWIKTINSFK